MFELSRGRPSVDSILELPEYPEMKALEISDRVAVESCTHRLPCSSQHNFTCIWMWDTDKSTRVARIGRNLVVEFPDWETRKPALTLIGDENIADAAMYALAFWNEPLQLIPDFVANQLSEDKFVVVRDRDQDDYVVDVVRLSNLAGGGLKYRRRAANQCAHALQGRLVVKYCIEQPDLVLFDLFDRWAVGRANADKPEIVDERRALERLISAWHELDLVVTGLYDRGRLIAADIQETLPSGAIGHCQKADISYKGSFPLLVRSSSKHLASLGVRELNIEEDLGIEGLRLSKLRWRPTGMVRKYRVQTRK